MTPTREQLDRWNDRLEEDAAMLAAAGDNSLDRFVRYNRPAALATMYLAELLKDNPYVETLTRRFGWRYGVIRNRTLEELLDLAVEYAAKHTTTHGA